jgi:hypothetical protein
MRFFKFWSYTSVSFKQVDKLLLIISVRYFFLNVGLSNMKWHKYLQ